MFRFPWQAQQQQAGSRTVGQAGVHRVVEVQESWVRRFEHLVVRGASFVFAVGGAYAFVSFSVPLDKGDPIQAVITVSLAIALGLASYFLSRGIADRLMEIFGGEGSSAGSVWFLVFFAPLFLACEFLEVFTNYAKAIPAVHDTAWLLLIPPDQRPFHVFCTYLTYCVVPLMSPCLAVVDMALERKKSRQGPGQSSAVVPPVAQQAQQQVAPRRPQQPVQPQPSLPVPPRQSVPVRPPMQPLPSRQSPVQQGTVGNSPPGVVRQVPPLQLEEEPELRAV